MTLAELSVIVQLVVSGGGEINTGDIDHGFLWRRFPDGMCERIDVSAYLKIPKVSTWINAYDMVSMTEQYFVKQGYITTNAGANDALCKAVNGTSTQGMYVAAAVPPPVVVPVPSPVITVGGTVTSLVSAEGVWTFGTATSAGGNALLLNGVATGGFGVKLTLIAGKVFTLNAMGQWYQWANGWISSVAPL